MYLTCYKKKSISKHSLCIFITLAIQVSALPARYTCMIICYYIFRLNSPTPNSRQAGQRLPETVLFFCCFFKKKKIKREITKYGSLFIRHLRLIRQNKDNLESLFLFLNFWCKNVKIIMPISTNLI